jgi:hypothetical protein
MLLSGPSTLEPPPVRHYFQFRIVRFLFRRELTAWRGVLLSGLPVGNGSIGLITVRCEVPGCPQSGFIAPSSYLKKNIFSGGILQPHKAKAGQLKIDHEQERCSCSSPCIAAVHKFRSIHAANIEILNFA